MSIAVFLLLAALLPFIATISAKAGGTGFTNLEPRSWLAKQTGWRGRANAAQANTFEALPLFYAALLYAHFSQADPTRIQTYAVIWLVLRLFYILAYIKDKGILRSALWVTALIINILLLFAA